MSWREYGPLAVIPHYNAFSTLLISGVPGASLSYKAKAVMYTRTEAYDSLSRLGALLVQVLPGRWTG